MPQESHSCGIILVYSDVIYRQYDQMTILLFQYFAI